MNDARFAQGRPRIASVLLALLLFAACSGDRSAFDSRLTDADPYAAQCATPRVGNDPYNGNHPYPDMQGTLANERDWVQAYMNTVYLWYRDIPQVDPSDYTVAEYGSVADALDAYFQALKTPKRTASGKRVDNFSFTYPTDQWNALSQTGRYVSYGVQFAALARSPPRDYRVAYTEPRWPAANDVIARGVRILGVDGADLVNGDDIVTLNAGLFPASEGEQHVFHIRDVDGSERDITLISAAVDETPVQNVKTVMTPTGSVGYLLFNDHIATAEGELIDAVRQLQADGIGDLVLDIRYNGGGYLDIASELAYMIAGPARTSGHVFARLRYNDKNPLADSGGATTGFHNRAIGFDPAVRDGTDLPTLDLGRVFVLTGPGTCSASEAIVNGLRGVDVDVVLVGDTTCGKPYGFYPTDNCGLSYFAIEFQTVNAKDFGDYADGFAPQCSVADDFMHALGDPQESLLAAALGYRDGGGCPTDAKRAGNRPVPQLLRSPVRENMIIRRPGPAT